MAECNTGNRQRPDTVYLCDGGDRRALSDIEAKVCSFSPRGIPDHFRFAGGGICRDDGNRGVVSRGRDEVNMALAVRTGLLFKYRIRLNYAE